MLKRLSMVEFLIVLEAIAVCSASRPRTEALL